MVRALYRYDAQQVRFCQCFFIIWHFAWTTVVNSWLFLKQYSTSEKNSVSFIQFWADYFHFGYFDVASYMTDKDIVIHRMMSCHLTKEICCTFWTCQMLTGGKQSVAMQRGLFRATTVLYNLLRTVKMFVFVFCMFIVVLITFMVHVEQLAVFYLTLASSFCWQ